MAISQSSLLRLSLLVILFVAVNGQHLPLPPLPYGYKELEPLMGERTLRLHHLQHHQAYTDKLNVVLEELRQSDEHKWLAKLGIDVLLTKLDNVPQEYRSVVRNAGGGYVNHDFFWQLLSPGGGGQPDASTADGKKLIEAIDRAYGSVDTFVQEFSLAAMRLSGSGWVWLVYDAGSGGKLSITTTANQDTPASDPTQIPIMTIDMWEHAFYLEHQNRRSDWIEAFWSMLSWREVARRYRLAHEGLPPPPPAEAARQEL